MSGQPAGSTVGLRGRRDSRLVPAAGGTVQPDRRQQQVMWALALFLLVAAGWLHLQAAMAFPRPWPDEAHFVTPALALVGDARLAVPELNAPRGIFWVPSGYYFAQAPLLLFRADPLLAARWLSWAGVTGFSIAAALVAVKAGANRWVAYTGALAWLCMPRVVAIANIARMEGVVLGVAAVSLWLLLRDRWVAAVGVALLAPLVHPLGIVVPLAVGGWRLVRRPEHPVTRAQWVVLAVAVALWVAQIGYFAAHLSEAAAHLRFQFTRKSGRPIEVRWWHALLLAASGAGGLAATLRWRGGSAALATLWTALGIAGGFVLIDLVGREMWYEPLGRETAVLLIGLAGTTAVRRLAASDGVRHATAVIAVVALVLTAAVAVRATLIDGWYGMRPAAASRAEWRDFSDDALAQLQQLDASGTGGAVVVIDPLSGFSQEVFARSWDRLRFVQPTPATPMDTTTADFVLVTPGAPFVTQELVDQWGAAVPQLDISSDHGTFSLQLIANPG